MILNYFNTGTAIHFILFLFIVNYSLLDCIVADNNKRVVKLHITSLLNETYQPLTSMVFDHVKCFYSWENIRDCYNHVIGESFSTLLPNVFYDTKDFSMRDVWFLYHLHSSYPDINITSYDDADVIIVPKFIGVDHTNITASKYLHFFDSVFELYPLILSKPHVIVYSNSVKFTPILQHPKTKYFHYITLDDDFQTMNHRENCTIVPWLFKTHYHDIDANKVKVKPGVIFDKDLVRLRKKYLVSGCWRHRPSIPERSIWQSNCEKLPYSCDWLNWDSGAVWERGNLRNLSREFQLSIASLQSINQSWYTLLPRGDACVRTTMFDVFQLDSLSIYAKVCHEQLPFYKIIDYRKFVEFVSVDDQYLQTPNYNIVQSIRDVFNETKALEGLEYLSSIRHVLQYSLNPSIHNGIRYDNLNIIEKDDDALTFSMKTLISDLCSSRRLKKCR